jgi:hypothetical protein
MVEYNCMCCDFITPLKSNYNRHLKTKKHLKNIRIKDVKLKKEYFEPQLTPNQLKLTPIDPKKPQKSLDSEGCDNYNYGNEKYVCTSCDKYFSSKSHLTRHLKKSCIKIKNQNENLILKNLLDEQKKMFEQERKHLYKQIETLLDKVGDTTINNTQTNNIQLNNYGKEDLSHITDSLKDKLIKMPYGMIPKLIEYVHFSNTKPENKNIALTNKNDNKIKIFSDNKWIYKNKDETINDLMDGKYFILDTYYENNVKSYNNYDKFRSFFDIQDKVTINNLKKECELVLLNNR